MPSCSDGLLVPLGGFHLHSFTALSVLHLLVIGTLSGEVPAQAPRPREREKGKTLRPFKNSEKDCKHRAELLHALYPGGPRGGPQGTGVLCPARSDTGGYVHSVVSAHL